ncbi:MAG: molybdopterin-dependent oxidoreductase [Actinobacteria bacterium]|nr:molybdopterin-dependent oxidoreductase [Actinomycetota bacterium]
MMLTKITRYGEAVGLAAVLGGLATGEISTHLATNLHNPIISIGNRVVDFVPNFMKELVIRFFGVNDKTFLLTCITIAIALLAMVIGRLFAQQKARQGQYVILAMTGIAVLASLFDAKAGPFAVMPSLITGGVTALILNSFSRRKTKAESFGGEYTRREALTFAGLIGAVAVASVGFGRLLQQQANTQLERLKVILPKALRPLPPPPTDPALGVPGLSTLFTPNSDFYRIDTALSLPDISLDTWTLTIDGMVSTPLKFTYKELTNRPFFELDDTIACVSNEIGGNLVGNARWLGIRLDDLVKEAGPLSRADQIMGHSVDGFTAGFPLAALDGRDAMIAFGMNGEVLPTDHGFPARIIVPGLYGYVSATKWLSRIELTRFDEKRGYWIPRGWSVLAPIKTSTRIDTPRNGARIVQGKAVIGGVAWAPTRGITKVEVKIDNGEWQNAKLGPELANTTWRQWWLKWNATSGEHRISARATDGSGDLQGEKSVAVLPNGAEGYHSIFITAE